jgi:hypothetical protein
MYFPEDIFRHIMSYFPRAIHHTTTIMKQLTYEYEVDHSTIFTKRYHCYYIKTKLSFFEYVFNYIIDAPYCSKRGLINTSFPASPGTLDDYYQDGINISDRKR